MLEDVVGVDIELSTKRHHSSASTVGIIGYRPHLNRELDFLTPLDGLLDNLLHGAVVFFGLSIVPLKLFFGGSKELPNGKWSEYILSGLSLYILGAVLPATFLLEHMNREEPILGLV
jgi:hypothetical protein